MKKFAIISILGAAAVFAGALALVFNSSFQTWAAKKALKSSAQNASLQSVSLGLKEISVKNFSATLPNGASFKAESLSVKYDIADLLFSSALNIDSATLSGASYALAQSEDTQKSSALQKSAQTQKSPSSTAEGNTPPQASETAQNAKAEPFKFAGLPISVNVKSLDAAFVFIADAKTSVSLAASLKSFSMPAGKIPTQGALKACITFTQNGARLEPINFDATILEDKSAQNSVLNLKTTFKDKELLALSTSVNPYANAFAGKIKCDVSDADLVGVAPQEYLTDFKAQIYADFSMDIAKNENSAKGLFNINCKEPERFSASLKAFKTAEFSGKFEFANRGSTIEAKALEASLKANSNRLALLTLTTPFSAKAQTLQEMLKALPNGKILELELDNISTELLSALGNNADLDFQTLRVKFALANENGKLKVATENPARLNIARVGSQDAPALTNLCADISLSADFDNLNFSAAQILAQILNGKDTLSLDAKLGIAAKTANLNARLKGSLNPLIKAVPSAAKFGGLNLSTDISATLSNFDTAKADLQSALAALKTEGGIFGQSNEKLLEFNISASKGILNANRLPLTLFAAFAPKLSGETVSAKIEFDTGKDISLKGSLQAKNISYGDLASSLSPDLGFDFSKDKNGAFLNLNKISLSNSAAEFLLGNAKVSFGADWSIKTADAKISSKLKPLFDQPVLSPYNNLSSGSAELEAKFTPEKLSANLKASGLAAKSVQDTLETLSANLDCRFSSQFKPSFATLALYANGANGKTNIDASFRLEDVSKISVDAKNIVVEDMQFLSKLFANPVAKTQAQAAQGGQPQERTERGVAGRRKIMKPGFEPAKTAKQTFETKDSKALWDCGFQAELSVKIADVTRGGESMAKNVSAQAQLLKNRVSISNASANVGSSPVTLSAQISFNEKADEPYTLSNAALKIGKLSVGKLIGGAEPIIDGDFDIDVCLRAKGRNITHLLNKVCGSAKVSSAGGTVRPLSKNSDSGAVAGAANALLKIGSAFLGKKVKKLDGISELAQMLSKFNYDKIELSALRDEKTYDVEIQTARLDAEDMFIIAAGKIEYDGNKFIYEQTMEIPATIYVKGGSKKHTMFSSGGFAKTKSAYDGYYTGPKFRIYGTASAPKTDLSDIIAKTSAALGGAILKLTD